MSCIEVSIRRLGGNTTASASRLGDFKASVARQNSLSLNMQRFGDSVTCVINRLADFHVRVGLVCGTSLGEYGIIWASDGKLITIENGYLIQA